MGLQRAWVVSCDADCRKRMILWYSDALLARQVALERNWETVLLADEEGTRVAWFCPRHARQAMAYITPDAEHEGWCPRRTRQGPCVCEVSQREPHMGDDALGRALRAGHGKGTHTVRFREEAQGLL